MAAAHGMHEEGAGDEIFLTTLIRGASHAGVALVVSNLPANAGDVGSIPGLGRYPEGGH